MSATPADHSLTILKLLPSVDELLNTSAAARLIDDVGAMRLTEMCRGVIDDLRSELRSRNVASEKVTRDDLLAEAQSRLAAIRESQRMAGIRRVINATGVVIHTNLGRAPLSDPARQALFAAAGYCNVEYDLVSGGRGHRGLSVESKLQELTGAEGALVVNNCAAAAFFVLSRFASGREVVISRGELVEIGGDFRVPDVLARSGAILKEVGTTNRTRLADYEKAISGETAMVLRVHPSNYRIVGFTATPSTSDLAGLARRKNVIFYEDVGSGVLSDLDRLGLADEPVVCDSISAGTDIVTFSGDKLLGGPQAGIIVGRGELVEQLRRDPLYRALRIDKLILAALEATLEAHLRGDAIETVPVLRSIATDPGALARRAAQSVSRINNQKLKVQLTQGNSAIGGGSAPLVQPETTLIAITHVAISADELATRLRQAHTPVIARIGDGKVLIDLRTVDESDEEELVDILNSLAA